jgi:hypothetical protein
MRWPFLFGRGSAAKDSHAPEPRASIRDWASLPAIQRAVGELQLTAPPAPFVQSLAGTREPDLSLEPLGHHVSLEGPSGLVTGLARYVETYAPSSDLVGRPRPRREAPVQRRMSSTEESIVASADGDDEAEGELAAVPVPTSFPVIDEAVPPRAALTRLADADAAAVLALSIPRPMATSAAHVDRPPTAPVGSEGVAQLVPAQRLTLGQSRRLGLGAPISSRQPTAGVQRSVEAPLDLAPPSAPAPVVPSVPRPVEPTGAASVSEIADTSLEPDAAGSPMTSTVERIAPLAGATVDRPARGGQAEVEPDIDLPLARRPAAEQFEAPPATGPVDVVQRVVARPLPAIYSRPAPAPTAPIVADRPPLLSVPRPSDSIGVVAEMKEPPAVQRLPSAAAAEASFLAPIDFRHRIAPRDSVEMAATPGSGARPLPPLALPAPALQRATPMAHDFVAISPFATMPSPVVAQRATAVLEIPAVQREVSEGEAAATQPSADSAPMALASSAAAYAGAAAGQSDKDLDELARKLHDRISMHLRRDLLIQRERAGMVTDLR